MDKQPPTPVILGATGFIGRNLLGKFSKDFSKTVGVARHPGNGLLSLDLIHPDIGPLELRRRGVTHAIIAAGVSKIAACEEDPVSSRKINVSGTVELAQQLCDLGIKVIAFSSDYVFDGAKGAYTEASPVSPVNAYAQQKTEMEKLLMKVCGGNALILRLSKVFDVIKGSGTLLDEIAGKLARGETVSAARDQFFCPVWIDDVVHVIGRLIATDAGGVMHLCAPQKLSRLELAQEMAERLGADLRLIQSISLSDLEENFIRPLDTSMVCDRLRRYVKYNFKDIHECIKELAANYRGNPCAEKV